MIKQQSRFSVNPLYIVAVAMCCVAPLLLTLKAAVIYSTIAVIVSLISVNLVSLVEKIADKNLRVFLIAMLAGVCIVLVEYVLILLKDKLGLTNIEDIRLLVLAVVTLSIVPTYFETRLTTKDYYSNLFFAVGMFLLLSIICSIICEFTAFGTLWGFQIFAGFSGLTFATELFFQLFVIAVLCIISNFIFQFVSDRKLAFNLLVDRYKLIIKETLIDNKENQND